MHALSIGHTWRSREIGMGMSGNMVYTAGAAGLVLENEYSFESSRRDLHKTNICTDLMEFRLVNIWKTSSEFCWPESSFLAKTRIFQLKNACPIKKTAFLVRKTHSHLI